MSRFQAGPSRWHPDAPVLIEYLLTKDPQFWFVGTSYSFGIIQAALVAEKVGSASTLSFVGSVTVVFIAVLAIPNARLIRWLGAQKTALLGVSLLGLGELSASFATKSIGGLFATVGVITGVGTR
jgi:hypothetical protein